MINDLAEIKCYKKQFDWIGFSIGWLSIEYAEDFRNTLSRAARALRHLNYTWHTTYFLLYAFYRLIGGVECMQVLECVSNFNNQHIAIRL